MKKHIISVFLVIMVILIFPLTLNEIFYLSSLTNDSSQNIYCAVSHNGNVYRIDESRKRIVEIDSNDRIKYEIFVDDIGRKNFDSNGLNDNKYYTENLYTVNIFKNVIKTFENLFTVENYNRFFTDIIVLNDGSICAKIITTDDSGDYVLKEEVAKLSISKYSIKCDIIFSKTYNSFIGDGIVKDMKYNETSKSLKIVTLEDEGDNKYIYVYRGIIGENITENNIISKIEVSDKLIKKITISKDDIIYFSTNDGYIYKYDGEFEKIFPNKDEKFNKVPSPYYVAIDEYNNLYFADLNNGNIRKFNYNNINNSEMFIDNSELREKIDKNINEGIAIKNLKSNINSTLTIILNNKVVTLNIKKENSDDYNNGSKENTNVDFIILTAIVFYSAFLIVIVFINNYFKFKKLKFILFFTSVLIYISIFMSIFLVSNLIGKNAYEVFFQGKRYIEYLYIIFFIEIFLYTLYYLYKNYFGSRIAFKITFVLSITFILGVSVILVVVNSEFEQVLDYQVNLQLQNYIKKVSRLIKNNYEHMDEDYISLSKIEPKDYTSSDYKKIKDLIDLNNKDRDIDLNKSNIFIESTKKYINTIKNKIYKNNSINKDKKTYNEKFKIDNLRYYFRVYRIDSNYDNPLHMILDNNAGKIPNYNYYVTSSEDKKNYSNVIYGKSKYKYFLDSNDSDGKYNFLIDKNEDNNLLYEVGVTSKIIDDNKKILLVKLIVLFFIILLILIIVTYIFVKYLLKNINNLKEATKKIDFENKTKKENKIGINKTGDEIDELYESYNNMIDKVFDKERAYAKFVPKEVKEYISKKDIVNVNLNDQKFHDVCILSVNIRSYYKLFNREMKSQNEDKKDVEQFRFINEFIKCIGSKVESNNSGFIYDFNGTGFTALFNKKDSVNNAVDASINMMKELERLNIVAKDYGIKKIDLNITLYKSSRLIFGIVGYEKGFEDSDSRYSTAIVDKGVMITNIIDKNCLKLGCSVVLTESIIKSLKNKDNYKYRYLGEFIFDGFDSKEKLYDLYQGDKYSMMKLKDDTKNDFEKAIELFEKEEWIKAKEMFINIISKNDNDEVAKIYFYLCDENIIKKKVNGTLFNYVRI